QARNPKGLANMRAPRAHFTDKDSIKLWSKPRTISCLVLWRERLLLSTGRVIFAAPLPMESYGLRSLNHLE
ncbi:MAG: hypothetical protein JW829_10845, partial [Pirellulales bacterium]|nr:hypothetical protein [Pirellulales bacterium]